MSFDVLASNGGAELVKTTFNATNRSFGPPMLFKAN